MFSHRNLCRQTSGYSNRRPMAIACGCVVVALAGYLATCGLAWSLHFHPDEQRVAKWIDQVRDEGYITDRAYPSGWFELFRVRLALEKAQCKILRPWQKHFVQNGKVDVVAHNSFSQVQSLPDERAFHAIQDGRDFNAWLYVFSALFLFAACLEVGQRPLAAFVSSLYFFASAAPIEFLHYCETDEGLVVSIAFFAWISARAIRKRSWWLVIFAGAAAGFATACKFTLFPLVLWCILAPVAILWEAGTPPRRRTNCLLGLVLAALVAAALGYAMGTPALRLAPDWYITALGKAAESTYAEINKNLGGVHSAWGADVHRLVSLGHELRDIGILPIAWAVFAWCFWFSRPFRRQALGLPVIMPLFIPFLVFCCPFVRRQETLPLPILFAMGAGLPLEWLLRADEKWNPKSLPHIAAVAAAGVLGVSALVAGAFRAGGMASCFMFRDTRAEVQNWLHDSVPHNAPIAFDAYVGESARGVDCRAIHLEGLPYWWEGRTNLLDRGVSSNYYIENVGFAGRLPIRDLRTGRLRPRVVKSLENFHASTFPLRSWSVSEDIIRPTFGQPHVRLLALEKPTTNSLDIPIGYCRPMRLLGKGAHLYDAEGVNGLGAARAVLTVGRRTTIHVNLDNGPRWLVTRMLAGNAQTRIVRDALFVPRESLLSSGSAVAATLYPSPWERLCSHGAAYSTTKCRAKGDDHAASCWTYIAATVAEAARELRAVGDPKGALAILNGSEPLDAEACVEAFLAASEAGVSPKDEWRDAARKALAACDGLSSSNALLEHRAVTLCGTPVEILGDFARVRLSPQPLTPGLKLPVYLPRGHYELSVVLSPEFTPENVAPRLFAEQNSDFQLERDEDGRSFMRTSLTIKRGQILQVMGKDGDSVDMISGNSHHIPVTAEIEISWSPLSQTLAVADTLRTALDKK